MFAAATTAVVLALFAPPASGKLKTRQFQRPHVVVVERPWPPLVELWVQLPVGALADPKGKEGLSHVTWQTAVKAAGKDSRKFARSLEQIGATLDSEVSARKTIVHGRVPTRHLRKFMAMVADVVFRPTMSPDQFKLQRDKAIAAATALVQDDSKLAAQASRRYLHRGLAQGRAFTGTPVALRSLRLQDAKRLHQAATANPLRFGFAGNVPREKALKLVAELFARPARRRKALTNRPSSAPKVKGRRLLVLDRKGRSHAEIVVLLPTVGANNPAMPALIAATTALGGLSTSRLVRQVRQLRGWSDSIRTQLLVDHKAGVLAVRWSAANRVVAASIDLVMGQLELLKTTGLTGAELAFVRDHLRGAHRLALETASGELAERMRALSLGLPVDYPQRLSAMIGRVDRKLLVQVLNKYFDPSKAIAVVVGDSSALTGSMAAMTSGFAIETIAYNGRPEATTVQGKLVKRTMLAKPPPPADPDEMAETGPVFDASGHLLDAATLPQGDTSTDADDGGDEHVDGAEGA